MIGARSSLFAAALLTSSGALLGCATVPSGWGGVLVDRGGVAPQPLGEGVHTIGPFAHVELYDLRAQVYNEDFAALSADGAPLEARASVLTFHILPDELVALAESMGPDYYVQVVQPIVRSTVRRVLASWRADALDTPGVLGAQAQIAAIAAERLRPFHIVLDSVTLRRISVPTTSMSYAVILRTGELEQEVLASPKRLELARQHAEERLEDARGIDASHRTVAGTLSPPVLADEAERAWTALVTAPTATVTVDSSTQTTVEVTP